MDNLSTFLKIHRLFSKINHGTARLDFLVRNGNIAGIKATGTKKTRYNSSKKDTNNNQAAVRHILGRITEQLSNGSSGELVFRIKNSKSKITHVEVESLQDILA